MRERWRGVRRPLGLIDPEAEGFGILGLAKHVESPAARLLVLPGDPESSDIEFDEAFWTWWNAEHPDPATGGSVRWGATTRPCSFAALRYDEGPGSTWRHYVALHRNGALDVTLGHEAAFESGSPPRRVFRLTQVVARVWAALSLYGLAIGRYAPAGPYEVSFALLGTRAGILAGFGREWAEPSGVFGEFGRCLESNLWMRREVSAWPDEAGVRKLAFSLGGCVEDGWGVRERRFLFRQGPQAGEFDPNSYRPW